MSASAAPLPLAQADTILCDADGTLYDSEAPAFEASAAVTNRFLAALGIERRFSGEELRRATTGKNFRSTARDLALELDGTAPDPVTVDRWVAEELRAVTAHLRETLRPDPAVTRTVRALGQTHRLAVVSSSADSRVAACLEAAGLDELFPAGVRFSAEDSLPIPESKPSPAIYRLAADALGVDPARAIAIEDSVPGVESAVAAGHPALGILQFVPRSERSPRAEALRDAGAFTVVDTWVDVLGLFQSTAGARTQTPA